MKKIILFFILSLITLGCSSDSDNGNATGTNPNENLKLVIDGVEMNLGSVNNVGFDQGVRIEKKGDVFVLGASFGNLSLTDSLLHMFLTFTTNGKVIDGGLSFNSYNFYNPTYNNYINFPSHYFQVDDFVVNEAQKRIKINLQVNCIRMN